MAHRQQLPIALASLALVACGARTRTVGGPGAETSAEPTEPAAGDTGAEAEAEADAPLRALIHLALEIEAAADALEGESEVRLVVTDETGAARREDLGLYIGTCQDVTRAERQGGPAPVVAFRCEGESARGVLVHVLWRAPELVVLRDWLDDDETAFDEIDRIALRPGVPITTDYD